MPICGNKPFLMHLGNWQLILRPSWSLSASQNYWNYSISKRDLVLLFVQSVLCMYLCDSEFMFSTSRFGVIILSSSVLCSSRLNLKCIMVSLIVQFQWQTIFQKMLISTLRLSSLILAKQRQDFIFPVRWSCCIFIIYTYDTWIFLATTLKVPNSPGPHIFTPLCLMSTWSWQSFLERNLMPSIKMRLFACCGLTLMLVQIILVFVIFPQYLVLSGLYIYIV